MKRTKLILIGSVLSAVLILLLIKYSVIDFKKVSKADKPQMDVIEDAKIYDLAKICSFKWNTNDGFVLRENPDFYLGITSFISLNNGSFAFLSDANNQIIITDDNQKIIKSIDLDITPRDLIYENGLFYVLTERKVLVYDDNGKNDEIEFPVEYSSTIRLFRYNHSTYLLLPNGNSLCIEQDGIKNLAIENVGWITSIGSFVKTSRIDKHNFYIEILSKEGTVSRKNFYHDSEITGSYFCGLNQNEVIIELQTLVSENPIKIKREIISVKLVDNRIDSIIFSYELPNTYYVMSNKDIDISDYGAIYFMISTQDGIDIFSLQKALKKQL